MVINISSLLSAFKAQQKSIETRAQNIANVNTPNYKAEVTTQVEGPEGLVETVTEQSEEPGLPYPPGMGKPGDVTSNVDAAREMVGLIQDNSSLQANLKVAGTMTFLMDQVLMDLGN